MEKIFGPVTASTIVYVVNLLTQVCKTQWKFEGKKAQLFALVLSAIGFGAFNIFTTFRDLDGAPLAWYDIGLIILATLIYIILGWCAALGFYSVNKMWRATEPEVLEDA